MGISRNMRFGTHTPVLIELLSKTKGAVLELGCGFSSTPLIYWWCQKENRKFESYDSNKNWIEMVNYPINFIKKWADIDTGKTHWSIVLIDQRPFNTRKESVYKFKDKADYLILHDSEDSQYGYEEIYPLFKYRFDYTKQIPHTTILSNVYDLKELNEKL